MRAQAKFALLVITAGMGMMGRGPSGPDTLATLTVAGETATPLEPVPHRRAVRDLRGRPIAVRRQIAFTMGMQR